MPENYKQTNDVRTIQRLSDGAFIPTVQDNKDYLEYLEWIAAGNFILPPDPVINPVITKSVSAEDLATLLKSKLLISQAEIDAIKK